MLERKELTGIIITLIIVKMLLVYPHELVVNAGQAAWLEVLYIIAIAFGLFFITERVYRYKKSVIELAENLGGRGLKIFTGIIIFIVFITNLSYMARIFPETVKVVLLKEINIEAIIIVFGISIGLGAYFGIKALARVNYIFLPLAGAVLIGCLLLLLPYYKAENILPIFGEGAKRLFLNGFNALPLFSDIIALNILLPYSHSLYDARISGKIGFFISSAAAFFITMAYCLSYVYPSSAEYIMPLYQLARLIHISNFFSRFESLFQFAWSILIFLYSSIYLFLACSVLQTTFSLKYLKPLIFPVTIIAMTAAGIADTVDEVIEAGRLIRIAEYPIIFAMPIIYGAVTLKRQKRGGRHI